MRWMPLVSPPSAAQVERFGLQGRAGNWSVGAGCADCGNTGYRGRTPVVEWLKVDNTMREAIRRREFDGLVPRKTLEQSARELLSRNLTNDVEYARTFGL